MTSSSPPAATVATSLSPAATAAVSAPPVGDGPPAASLAAEGGDAVEGQLGTYIWRDGGSDSPWLPGSRIAVGAGEPLSVELDPAIEVAAWQARSVPAGVDGPAGAASLGEGTGTPAFPAPGSGTWTIEVHVAFDRGIGDASYFWRLEVSG
jgi:hypothetical protein